LRNIATDATNRWTYCDSFVGSTNASTTRSTADDDARELCTVVALPGLSGNHEIFFRLQSWLWLRGVRMITADYPAMESHTEFVDQFEQFLDKLQLNDNICVLGTMLGGYLAQLFAQVCGITLPPAPV
jgi:pimeloyl-ACP methyl ester carboxylesterase